MIGYKCDTRASQPAQKNTHVTLLKLRHVYFQRGELTLMIFDEWQETIACTCRILQEDLKEIGQHFQTVLKNT